MSLRQNLGKAGEDLACQYLKNKGYQILKRNYWKPWGEIDIIARSPKGILVFVEVKTGKVNSQIEPEQEMTKSKISKLKRTCQLFAGKYNDLINEEGWRIDLIAISTDNQTNQDIRHYENII